MNAERWQKVKKLCDVVLECEPARRSGVVAELCGGDEELKHDVETLLSQASTSGNILNGSVWQKLGAPIGLKRDAHGGQPARHLPETVGSYRIVRLIGEGGMGAVYEAEQDNPRRVVALKVIKPGWASPELLRRFELESQALGRLQHPGIAQIYEAGSADTGVGLQPYFAMEFIRGETLKDYADTHHLNPRQRLELMARICDAVEHAHQRGIIHRDLKPGNILVDETGQPKILDFGVARITDSDAQATRQTDLGQVIGTLAYMSPEQVLADPLELDTRSDVYALGIILYQFLSGRLPYELSAKLLDAVRTIREEEPAHLSSINREYRGDIETIAAKALEKDKTRRYASAAALGEDIRRYLGDEPIAARPASTAYQLQKFARRHKALVSGLAAVMAVLMAGIMVSTWQAVRARRAERAAIEAQQTAQAVNDFLQNDLLAQASADKQAAPDQKPDPDLKVRTALDRAAARISGKFDRQPEVEASVRDTIGQTYMDLGLYAEARTQFERALELHRRALGPENAKSLKTVSRLGRIALLMGKHPEAEQLLNQTVQIQRRVSGPEHPDTLYSMANLGSVYAMEGKLAQAEGLDSQTVEIQRRLFGTDDPATLASMNNLANVYSAEGKNKQAETLDNQVLDIRRRVLGPEHPDTLTSMNNLSVDYNQQGKYDQAEVLDTQVLEIRRRVSGPEHRDTLMAMGNLGLLYNQQGKYAQAEELLGQTVEISRRALGPEHPYTLVPMENLAEAYKFRGKYREAEALYTKTLDSARRVLGAENPYTLAFLADFASMYQRQNQFVLAETHAARALEGRRHVLGPEDGDTMMSAADLTLAYLSQGKFSESERLAREVLEFFLKKAPENWQRSRAETLLGASLAGQNKYAEAEPLLLEGYRGLAERKDRMSVPDRYHLERAGEWLILFYKASGNPDKATEWQRQIEKAGWHSPPGDFQPH